MDFKDKPKKSIQIPILQFRPHEFQRLKSICERITADPSETPDLYCSQLNDLSCEIPERIQKEFMKFKKNEIEPGLLIVKGISLDKSEIPRTPSTNNEKMGEKTLLAKIQGLLMSLIAEMIAYEAEGYGRLFQDIVPVESCKETQTSLGSTELEIHTEQAFSKLKPDILCLACLKGDLGAYTHLLPIETIVEKISFHEYCLLRRSLWKTGVDLSFKLNGVEFIDGDIRGPLAIINGSALHPELIFDQDLMNGITEESEEMIQRIIDIYYKHRISYNLVEGDIMFINNNRAVHGRSAFTPKYDGNDRFLIRCFGTYHYTKSEYARPNNARVISAIYS
jgi:L-asparagine oxygenase